MANCNANKLGVVNGSMAHATLLLALLGVRSHLLVMMYVNNHCHSHNVQMLAAVDGTLTQTGVVQLSAHGGAKSQGSCRRDNPVFTLATVWRVYSVPASLRLSMSLSY
mmetsp:Transcript_15926/g.26471  ORF Transcript_15926/g.26471 Transcript_15926/m.26471 type:complete len:108 (+) Transcript_15926:904-1227(+)